MIAPRESNDRPQNEAAFEWHRKPAGFDGLCPICGCTAKQPNGRNQEHRAVREGENFNARWVTRRKSGDGWKYKTAGDFALPSPATVQPKIDRRIGPTDRVLHLLTKAATQAAFGRDLGEICAELGIGLTNLMAWKAHHAALWDSIYGQVVEKVVKAVRQAAGTDAVLEDPERFIQMAAAAEKWCERKGRSLFDSDGKKTVGQFYREYYVPTRLAAAAKSTLHGFDMSLRRWALLTGDPPLEKISSEMLARYRNALAKLKGQKPGTLLSPNSVRRHLRHLQAVINKAGPPGYRNRDAAGIITTNPWCQPPKEVLRPVRIVAPEHLKLAYDAAAGMDVPRLPGIKPPAWWKALLVVAYNTGLRLGSLFALRMEHIDWEHSRLVIPPDGMKSGRWHVIHLNTTAIDHLRGIRTDRENVFPWPMYARGFHLYLHVLQDLAGIPAKDHFGMHTIRKTTATALWSKSPQASQFALGHAGAEVTMRHYVQSEGIVADAIDALPQPWGERKVSP